MIDCCPCADSETQDYALDAAGQKVVAGDYVMASLPNVPATRRPRVLHPCQVVQVQQKCFHLLYAGNDPLLQRWARETFLRWRNEVVKADMSFFGLTSEDCSKSCRTCRGRTRVECDGD